MEIVCRPETYRRFESSSLRQEKHAFRGVFFRGCREDRKTIRINGGSRERRSFERLESFVAYTTARCFALAQNARKCAKKNTPFEACFFMGAEKIERLSELTEVCASGVFFLAFSVQVVYNMYVIKEKGI